MPKRDKLDDEIAMNPDGKTIDLADYQPKPELSLSEIVDGLVAYTKGLPWPDLFTREEALHSLQVKIDEARQDGFFGKFLSYPIFEQQLILGSLLYKYLLLEPNATTANIKLDNFSQKGKVLGDLEITAQLKKESSK